MVFKHTKAALVSAAILSALVVAAVGCSKAPSSNLSGNSTGSVNVTPTIEDEGAVSPVPGNSKNINSAHAIALPKPIVPVSQVMPNYTPGITLTPSATNVMEVTPG